MKGLLEPRGILAVLVIVGCFTLAGVSMAATGSPDLPDWAVALVSTVSTFFFASRGSEKATENHVQTTDRLFQVEQKVEENVAQLAKRGEMERRNNS